MGLSEAQLNFFIQQDSPQVLLFIGPSGSGKKDQAMEAGRAWSQGEPIDFSDNQIVMSKVPAEGKVSMQTLQDYFSLSPGNRQAIILNLDGAGIEVQNAILKRFEEPTNRTWVLALTTNPARLLPTIRSRCQTISVPKRSRDDLAAWALMNNINHTEEEVVLAEGSSERLVWIVDNRDTVDAVKTKDAAKLLHNLRTQDEAIFWCSNVLGLMKSLHWTDIEEARQILSRGGKPEAALAVALLA